MKASLVLLLAGIISCSISSGQNLQSVTDTGSSTSNPITISPVTTTTTTGTISPALSLIPDYVSTGPVTVIPIGYAFGSKPGTYSNVPVNTTTGSGTGLIINLTIVNSFTYYPTIVNGGTGYRAGDRLTIPLTSLGGTGSGVATMHVGNISGTNTFSTDNAPLQINSYLQALGYAGAYTPMMSFNTKFRDNTSATVSPLTLGYYWKNATTPYWAFLSDTSYLMGFSSAGVDINKLSGTTARLISTNSSNITITNGPVIDSGICNNSFFAQSSVYEARERQEGNTFLSNQVIESGAVEAVSLLNSSGNIIPGTYENLPVAGGSGNGLLLSLTADVNGNISALNIGNNNGSNYKEGESVTITLSNGSAITAKVTLRNGHNFTALTHTSTYKSKTGDHFYTIRSTPVITLDGAASSNVYGYYYDPEIISLRGKHIAFENTTGNVLFCTTSGNVGIGTTHPTSKLTVKGTVLTQRVKISQAAENWPDYVFKPGYQLPDAEETEAFIKKNKHLPGLPFAEEAGKQPSDLSNTEALLLKKVEELTLLIIEQHKQLNQQKERIRQLESEQ